MVNDRLAWIDEGNLEVGFSEFEKPLNFGVNKGFSINENDKILLLGNNASGKTQLLLKFREMINQADYDLNIIELSSEELGWSKRKSGKDITSFLFNFYNDCKLKNESKSENEKIVILMDNPLRILDTDTGDILLELFSTLECTVIITDLLDSHFKYFNHSMQEGKVHWSTYPKKIIIDDYNHFGSKKLIFIDSSMNRNIAEYEQIGTYLEIKSSTQELLRKSRRSNMFFRKKIIDIEKDIHEIEKKVDNQELLKLKVKLDHVLKELIDLERRLALETSSGVEDHLEVALIIEQIQKRNDEAAKYRHDLEKMNHVQEITSYPKSWEINEYKDEIMILRSQFQDINHKIIMITRPMEEIEYLTKEFGLSYSERKRELLSEIKYSEVLILNEKIDENRKLSMKLNKKNRERRYPGRRYPEILDEDMDEERFKALRENIAPSEIMDKMRKIKKKEHDLNPNDLIPNKNFQKHLVQYILQTNKSKTMEEIAEGWGKRQSADSIDSSIAMVLSNTRKDPVPDDLRKLALHFSRIFLNNQEKTIKKLFIVNNIEKLIKYSINTVDDRENTLIVLHDNSTKKGDLIRTYIGPNPKKYRHADIFVLDCDGDIKPSKVRMYLNKFRRDGTATHGHLMFIDINEDYSLGKKKSIEKHSFNSWIENLHNRTSAQIQSQSAGLHEIIKISFDGKVPMRQSTRKADEIMKNINSIYDQITNEWQDLGLRNLIETKKNIEQNSDGSLEIKEYINGKIKSYDFGKERKLYKQIWREDHETEDSLEDWYNIILED